MKQTLPATRDLVLIGGGHAHALVLRKWGMNPLPGARLTLVTPGPTAPYTGMLPGHVAGHYPREALDIDLMRLARFAGARVILDPAVNLDLTSRHVLFADRAPAHFDVLSINVGVTSTLPDLPGFADHAIPAKPLGRFADRWEAFCADVEAERIGADIAVIGCGIAGAELALAMRHRLKAHRPRITILEAADALGGASAATRGTLEHHLDRAGITIREGVEVRRITADRVHTASGEIPSNFTVGAAGATPHPWIATSGLPTHDGFVCVGETLASIADPAIFAAGDCAHMTHAPREKAGVYAVRQAPILVRNLRAALGSGTATAYAPQKGYLKLVSLGGKSAVADWRGFAPSGAAMWRWKDRIDRKFMDQFDDLPAMTLERSAPAEQADGVSELLAAQPLCGGCGAKVGSATIRDQLSRLPRPVRDDVFEGAGDDAAILRHRDGFQTFTTDHFRAFVEDPWLLSRIAALHAMGDVWAMGGQPQAALSQLILPRMSERLQAEMLREITDAASAAFREAGADLVGGHTSLGAELTVGFSLTGLVRAPVRLQGAQAGDALLLTKPLGTGTILAADMLAAAPGAAVAAALSSMSKSSASAAVILAPVAHAMTDVTGFGLAGHLFGMLDASGLSAEVTDLPLIAGARELAAAGHRSSLFPQNSLRSAEVTGVEGPERDLLFDPQTSGGLLAAVDACAATEVLARLQDAGHPARQIGQILPGGAGITLR